MLVVQQGLTRTMLGRGCLLQLSHLLHNFPAAKHRDTGLSICFCMGLLFSACTTFAPLQGQAGVHPVHSGLCLSQLGDDLPEKGSRKDERSRTWIL